MFSGAVSVRIKSEQQILVARLKARWLAEKVGFDKLNSGVLSTLISEMARQVLAQAKSGRIDVVSVRDKMKTGITIMAFIEQVKKEVFDKKIFDKRKIIKRINFQNLAAKHIIDDYRTFPSDNREVILQITKWI